MSQGGIIGRPNVPTFGRASGLWRVGEVFNARTTDTWPIVLPSNIGDPFLGGFFAGIIDTNQPGAILPEDQYQTPLRYALVVSPRSLQTDLRWRSANTTVVSAQTRWNGLAAQEASTFQLPAFEYCDGLPFPDDGGSKWYLPALDELTEAYWNLKPTTDDNSTGTRAGDFPDDEFNRGELFSSDPQRPPFTAGTPEQTDATDFQEGGDQEFIEVGGTNRSFWSASWRSSTTAWFVAFANGLPGIDGQTTTLRVRPFRRVVLPSEE